MVTGVCLHMCEQWVTIDSIEGAPPSALGLGGCKRARAGVMAALRTESETSGQERPRGRDLFAASRLPRRWTKFQCLTCHHSKAWYKLLSQRSIVVIPSQRAKRELAPDWNLQQGRCVPHYKSPSISVHMYYVDPLTCFCVFYLSYSCSWRERLKCTKLKKKLAWNQVVI